MLWQPERELVSTGTGPSCACTAHWQHRHSSTCLSRSPRNLPGPPPPRSSPRIIVSSSLEDSGIAPMICSQRIGRKHYWTIRDNTPEEVRAPGHRETDKPSTQTRSERGAATKERRTWNLCFWDVVMCASVRLRLRGAHWQHSLAALSVGCAWTVISTTAPSFTFSIFPTLHPHMGTRQGYKLGVYQRLSIHVEFSFARPSSIRLLTADGPCVDPLWVIIPIISFYMPYHLVT